MDTEATLMQAILDRKYYSGCQIVAIGGFVCSGPAEQYEWFCGYKVASYMLHYKLYHLSAWMEDYNDRTCHFSTK